MPACGGLIDAGTSCGRPRNAEPDQTTAGSRQPAAGSRQAGSRWHSTNPPLSRTETDFLHASDRARRRRALRRQALIALLTALVVGFAAATVIAVRATQQVTHQLEVVTSGLLSSQSQLVGDADPALSKLLSVAAWRISPSSTARHAMLAAAARPGIAILGDASETVNSVAFSPDGKTLAAGSADDTVELWDVTTRQLTGSLVGPAALVNSVAFSPDGKTLAAGTADGTVRFWNVATQQPAGSPIINGQAGGVSSLAFSPDGKTLATGNADDTARLWDLATRRPIGVPLAAHAGPVNSVAFSPDGKTLATGNADDTARLWDLATHRQLGPPLGRPPAPVTQGQPPGAAVTSVAFSPDGTILASGNADDTVELWNVATHQPIGFPRINGQAGGVSSVAFSPDGKTLATGSYEETVQLWNVATHQPIGGPFTGHGGSVTSVAFSPDGKTLASGSYDLTVRLWNVAAPSQNVAKTTDLVRYLCALAGRSFTRAEWAEYVPHLAYQMVCP